MISGNSNRVNIDTLLKAAQIIECDTNIKDNKDSDMRKSFNQSSYCKHLQESVINQNFGKKSVYLDTFSNHKEDLNLYMTELEKLTFPTGASVEKIQQFHDLKTAIVSNVPFNFANNYSESMQIIPGKGDILSSSSTFAQTDQTHPTEYLQNYINSKGLLTNTHIRLRNALLTTFESAASTSSRPPLSINDGKYFQTSSTFESHLINSLEPITPELLACNPISKRHSPSVSTSSRPPGFLSNFFNHNLTESNKNSVNGLPDCVRQQFLAEQGYNMTYPIKKLITHPRLPVKKRKIDWNLPESIDYTNSMPTNISLPLSNDVFLLPEPNAVNDLSSRSNPLFIRQSSVSPLASPSTFTGSPDNCSLNQPTRGDYSGLSSTYSLAPVMQSRRFSVTTPSWNLTHLLPVSIFPIPQNGTNPTGDADDFNAIDQLSDRNHDTYHQYMPNGSRYSSSDACKNPLSSSSSFNFNNLLRESGDETVTFRRHSSNLPPVAEHFELNNFKASQEIGRVHVTQMSSAPQKPKEAREDFNRPCSAPHHLIDCSANSSVCPKESANEPIRERPTKHSSIFSTPINLVYDILANLPRCSLKTVGNTAVTIFPLRYDGLSTLSSVLSGTIDSEERRDCRVRRKFSYDLSPNSSRVDESQHLYSRDSAVALPDACHKFSPCGAHKPTMRRKLSLKSPVLTKAPPESSNASDEPLLPTGSFPLMLVSASSSEKAKALAEAAALATGISPSSLIPVPVRISTVPSHLTPHSPETGPSSSHRSPQLTFIANTSIVIERDSTMTSHPHRQQFQLIFPILTSSLFADEANKSSTLSLPILLRNDAASLLTD